MLKRFFKGLALVVLLAPSAASAALVGETEVYTAAHEDTLPDLAYRFGVGFVELKAANPDVDVWLPGEGTKVTIPRAYLLPDVPHEGIVINITEMRLYDFTDGIENVRTYPIGVGRDGLGTPLGETTIVRKKEGPTWTPTPRMRRENPDLPQVVPPGPENPLGTHALYLGWPAYLIHGTSKPLGVGRRVSSGCIRLYPEDIKKVFGDVPVGTKVRVIDQPFKVDRVGEEIFVEVHPTQQQADELEMEGDFKRRIPQDLIEQVMEVAGASSDSVDWDKVAEAGYERRGFPIRVTN